MKTKHIVHIDFNLIYIHDHYSKAHLQFSVCTTVRYLQCFINMQEMASTNTHGIK